MLTSSTLENDNIQAFKNDNNIYIMKKNCILYTRKWYIQALKNDNIYTMKNDINF